MITRSRLHWGKRCPFERRLTSPPVRRKFPGKSGGDCYLNNILRRFMDVLADDYPWVVVDNEAGMARRGTEGIRFRGITH